MSVIGVNQLNSIVQERNILDPSEILKELNLGVNKILKQNQRDIADGMDLALLKVDHKNRSLTYAGANRPLYLVLKGKLSETKATKSPIGGMDSGKEKMFASHIIQLQEGDMVYLSTDGYADQFGGAKSKKITTKKLKGLLESASGKSLFEQEKLLKDTFFTHKGTYEQTDDVLVVGMKW